MKATVGIFFIQDSYVRTSTSALNSSLLVLLVSKYALTV